MKSEADGSPEKSKLHAEGVEEASSSVGTASSTGQQEGQFHTTDFVECVTDNLVHTLAGVSLKCLSS